MGDEIRGLVTEAGLANVIAARDEAQAREGGVTGPGTAPGHVGQPDLAGAGAAGVRERMEVVGSDGRRVGVVDHVEGRAILLTRNDSPDGRHHYIPADWIDRVEGRVFLRLASAEAERGWKEDAASCG